MNSNRSTPPGLRARLQRAGVTASVRILMWPPVTRLIGRLYHMVLVGVTHNFAKPRWLGAEIWQSLLDLWTIQETIAEVKPDLLVEIGTHKGGSALFYAQLMDLIGTGQVVTVDIKDIREVEHPRITFVHGSSTDPAIVERVKGLAAEADGPVMVIVDGNHDRDHVAAELELYAPLVTPGSLLLSQDGAIDTIPFFADSRPGPLDANREFLAGHPEFEYDRERTERFGFTQHPLGWIRRRT